MNSKMLLIWNEVPESTKAYVFDTSSEYAEIAQKCSGVYINTTQCPDNHPIHELSIILENEGEGLDTDCIMTGPFAYVVVCGFIS